MNWLEHTNVIGRMEDKLEKLEKERINLERLIAQLNRLTETQEKINVALSNIADTLKWMEAKMHD